MWIILLNILVVLGFGLALFLATRTFQMTHPEFHEDTSLLLYERGNASEEVRLEVLEQLEYFNENIISLEIKPNEIVTLGILFYA